MPAKYVITSAQFFAVPAGNQICTVMYKLCSSATYIVASNNVVVQPNGQLVTPLTITGLIEGTCYDVAMFNNCGGDKKSISKQFNTPVTGGANNVTFLNGLDSGSISQIYLDTSNTVLSTPLTAGLNVVYNYNSLGAGPHLLEANTTGISNGTWLRASHVRGSSELQHAYFQYAGARFTMHPTITFANGDVYILRNGNIHLKVDAYTANEGFITGTCNLGSFNITRSAQATADATATSATVTVTITWNADNGGTLTSTVTFNPTDTSVSGTTGTIGSGPCSAVTGTITSVM